ncbi:MAG TPA: hypothetical protein VJK29_12020, partial [Terriglobales bacterium]|nr:hypothetical protein [Terriglobales bacterium]
IHLELLPLLTTKKKLRASPMANDSKFKPGQSGNPETKFKPGDCHRWQPGQSGNPAGMPGVARDGTTQHYTTLTIPLTDVYLDPTLRMK